ncbi:MAG: hypothetical protein A3B99_00260 [Candidatus Yanofskybacteria bacterium RIFCSPHIGHO2_02_FULL_44_12b]|nr:MAG: hypothetical protein A2659_01705 [Candidatus Yanofskybacteria bacterium RIFCSPHIGHO2_01_FULL_44_24]OGN14778.1 MAG: hypothetical protein A3B99_00260 [Candidatus Yanofskybacteria bacterium RIFCSPHIGHO2_02_FULL_44_12b]OGN25910.1 MAG: hypothetical protein A2925_02625 [Candidatus Yanofskybacteria bacterium RIFCSPLOWO2_01_FULL_44_22]
MLKVTINLVVLNGEKYIRHFLDAVLAQTYPHELIEFNILDNGSLDNTIGIIENFKFKILNSKFPKFDLVKSKSNLGMWPGQEELLKRSSCKYVLAVAVDVILDKDFIKNAVEVMERDEKIGALQAKIYRYELTDLQPTTYNLQPTIIDTFGFKIFKSRRLVNMGHGEKDIGQYDPPSGGSVEIFGVEGAAPFFRKSALESCRIPLPTTHYQLPTNEIFDHDYFWYGDDFDLAWRMNLFGWKQIFAPAVIAWHDRQTTKTLRKNWMDFIRIRREVPMRKRGLDWRNTRFTILKNDYIINILKDLPYILKREIMLFGYILIFEPRVLSEVPNFLRFFPKMLRKRREIMSRAKVGPNEIGKWFS